MPTEKRKSSQKNALTFPSEQKSLLQTFKEQVQSLKSQRNKYVLDYETAHKGFCQEIDRNRTLLEELIDQKDKFERQFANRLKAMDEKIQVVKEKIDCERSLCHA